MLYSCHLDAKLEQTQIENQGNNGFASKSKLLKLSHMYIPSKNKIYSIHVSHTTVSRIFISDIDMCSSNRVF